MNKVKAKKIMKMAKDLNLLDNPPVKLWVEGTITRRTFYGISNNAADYIRDYLDGADSEYTIAKTRSMKGSTHYYHLAPNLQAYIEADVKIAGVSTFPTELTFYTKDEALIKTIVAAIQKLWITPMLDGLHYKNFEKEFKVTPEEIKDAWKKWADIDETIPTSKPPFCPKCGKPTTFIAEYKRYYCYSCEKYV
jgi:ribosomal protein S27AE